MPSVTEDYDSYIARLNPVLGWPSQAAVGHHDRDQTGSRIIPAFPDPDRHPACVSLYGDSFTWGEETDNEHAWSNVLAKLLHCRVANYGVGGYGVDQAFLRFHSNRKDTGRVAVIGFSSENIRRSVNQCRNLVIPHNQCGLKPRFILNEQGDLKLVPIPPLTAEQYRDLNEHPEKYLKHDFFIPGESSGIPRLHFPYSLAVFKVFKHIVFETKWGEPAYASFYHPDHPSRALQVTTAILKAFYQEARTRGKKALVLIVPIKPDLYYYQKTHRWIFQELLDNLKKNNIPTLNAGTEIMAYIGDRNIKEIYSEGGHFNREGYQLIGNIVYQYLATKHWLADKQSLIKVESGAHQAGYEEAKRSAKNPAMAEIGMKMKGEGRGF